MAQSVDTEQLKQFVNMLRRSEEIVKSSFPVQGRKHTIRAANFRWRNVGPDVLNDVVAAKEAKLKEKSINSDLLADVEIVDNSTGKVVEQKRSHVLLYLPHLTMNDSFIIQGKERQIINQLRLRPGMYTRFTADNNVEAFLNTTAAGTYKVLLDRNTGVIKMRVGTHTHFPLYSVLLGVGFTDGEIRQLLGVELYQINMEAAKPQTDLPKLLRKLRPFIDIPTDRAEQVALITAFFASKPLDPEVNKVTVKAAIDKIDKSAFRHAVAKIIKLSKGEAESDDTESLAFKSIHSVEDFIPERLEKSKEAIIRKIKAQLNRKPTIRLALPPSAFSDPAESFFTTSEFTRYSSQNNPLDMAAVSSVTTVLGEGGISSSHGVTNEVRSIHPSHFGLLDILHGPEGCYSADMEVMAKQGWIAWPDVTEDTLFACLLDNGELTYEKPLELQIYERDEELLGFRSATLEYLVTKQHRMWVRPPHKGAEYRFENADITHTKVSRKVRIDSDLPYAGNEAVTQFELPEPVSSRYPEGYGREPIVRGPFDIDDWAEFLGWYISEGCTNRRYVVITQKISANPENVARISALLKRLGFTGTYSGKTFSISSEHLAQYCRQFGYCQDKYLPEEVFDWPVSARERLLESLLLGDGRGFSAYCTTSVQLSKDVERLIFSLGLSCQTTFESDDREERYLGCYVTYIHRLNQRDLAPKLRAEGSGYFTEHYTGKVYCATVPGGRLYVRRNNKNGFWCGNSSVGVTSHLTIAAKKKGNSLFLPVYDARTGKRVEKSVQELDDKTVAFPDQYTNLPDGPGNVKGVPKAKASRVKARAANVLKEVSAREVDYIFTSPDSFFSSTTAIVPFLPNNDANRVLMADKHVEQSVQLKEPDVPLVQHRIRGKGYEEHFGKALNVRAATAGTVTKVTDDKISIKGSDGKIIDHQIHNHFPLNSATFLHDTPAVKVGDKVKEGQRLADNAFTKDDTLALGKQLRVAFTAYKGYNFEDGIVISEGAAKKLTSIHKYEFRVEKKSNVKVGRDVYVAAFPQELTALGAAGRFTKDGLPKKGTILNPGDIVIPAVAKVEINPEYQYEKLHKSLQRQWKDVSEKWTHDFQGEVIDVVMTRGFAKVIVKSEEPMQVGDKLSSRHGSKGIVVKIIPDNEMYKDESGEVIDVLFNPAGVPGRVNPGQLLESATGKLAKKQGRVYYTDNFKDKNNGQTLSSIQEELRRAGVSDEETIVDPQTGHQLSDTLVGDKYFFKLKHQVSGKIKSRSTVSESYSQEEQPVKGGKSSAQKIGILDTFSLLSGDATEFLSDAYGLKSQKNDEYWRAVQSGLPTPPPKTPFVEEKFVTMLMGAGINLKQEGTEIRATPFTDKEIRELSRGAISRPTVVKASNMRPEKGGLFDPAKTGGVGGKSWTHIELVEPIVNPLMLDPVASVARLDTKKQLEQIIEGTLAVTEDGEITSDISSGKTGGEGARILLKDIDVDKEITKTIAETKTLKGVKLDKAYKRLRYLKALKEMELSPIEAYTNDTVPIIPPKFRQINMMDDGRLSVADANHGYREVLLVNEKLKQLKEIGVSEEHTQPLKTALFGAVSGLVGTTAPLTRSKDFKGFIEQIKGPAPKYGFFQAKVQARTQDLSGRSTIIPNPHLHMDEVGLPEELAFNVYKPFVVKRLRNSGHTPLEARKMVEDRHPLARKALEVEAQDRPTLANRAPSLHKFNMVALKPRIIDGKAIEINPLIVGGLNADFDGDNQLGSVLGLVLNTDRAIMEKTLGRNWFSSRQIPNSMAARYNVSLSQISNAGLYVINLEDFIHCDTPSGVTRRNNAFFFDVPDGIKVLALNEATGKIEPADVKYWSVHTDCPVITVELKSGRQIVTDDDPRAVYGCHPETLEYVRARPSESEGLFVPRAKEVILEDSITSHEGVNLTPEIGYYIGAMAGDGWVSHDYANIASIHDEIIQEWHQGAEQILDDDAHYGIIESTQSYGESRRAVISRVDLGRWTAPLIGKGARNKHLPPFSSFVSEDIKCAILSGLLDTDGSVSISRAKKKPQVLVSLFSTSIRLVQDTQHLLLTLGVRSRITAGKGPAGQDTWILNISIVDAHKLDLNLQHPKKARVWEEFKEAPAPSGKQSAQDLVPFPSSLGQLISKALGSKQDQSLYVIVRRSIKRQEIPRASAKRLLELEVDHELWNTWKSIVRNESLLFDRVKGFTETNRVETGYDLTVPGYETFVSVDGTVLSNTMGVHVPVSEEARQEALDKLLPSKNLISPRDSFVIHAPSKETVLGVYLMTTPKGKAKSFKNVKDLLKAYRNKKIAVNQSAKIGKRTTCAGQHIFAQAIPSKIGFKPRSVNAKVLKALLLDIANKLDSDEAGDVISKIKDLGNHYVTEVGFSVSLKDLEFDYKKRDAVVAKAKRESSTKGFDKAHDDAHKELMGFVAGALDNRFVEAGITSGALGKGNAITRMIATPLAVQDHKGKPVPITIEKSYAEGHDIGAYLATTPGARQGLVDKGISVADTGYFNRMIVNSSIENTISENDCGTEAGISLPVTSKDVLDRYIASGPHKGKLVTPELVRELRGKRLRDLMVRSPISCESTNGICQMCFGLDENGRLPRIGFHVGAMAGQAVGERATQLMLRKFHTSGAIGNEELSFDRLKQLTEMPQNVKNSAVLAEESGTVTSIAPAPAGGWHVYIGTIKHYVPKELELKVSVGSSVSAGDQISKLGVIKPQDLLNTTGSIQRVRTHIIDELDQGYQAAGQKVKRKLFETIVKPLTDRATVSDPGGAEELFNIHPGDVIPVNLLEKYNRELRMKGKPEIEYDSILLGTKQVPHHSDDFVGALVHERLKAVLKRAPQLGLKTDLKKGHPMARLALTNLRDVTTVR